MSVSFDDRRKGFESKWAHDAETRFKVEAKRNYQLGLWAAGLKGLSGEKAEAFAGTVIAADLAEPGDEDVFRKLRAELPETVNDKAIRDAMAAQLQAAIDHFAKQA
jgi:hypothetical protein